MDKKELLIQAVRKNIYKFKDYHTYSDLTTKGKNEYKYKDLVIKTFGKNGVASQYYISYKSLSIGGTILKPDNDVWNVIKDVRIATDKIKVLKRKLLEKKYERQEIVDLEKLKREYL